MKNVYDKITEIKIEGVSKDWEETSIWNHDVVLDETEVENLSAEYRFPTFEDCYNQAKDGKIRNTEVGKTLFRGRPQIYVSSAMRDCRYTMEENNYKPVCMRVRYQLRKGLSMDYLMRNLSAEDFTDYVRSHNLVMCPMKNN